MTSPPRADLSLSMIEFIPLAALLTCLTALSIDIMLPVLPALGRDLGLTRANDQQWVVTTYLGGLVIGQLFVGSISDRFGRLPVLFCGLALFIFGAAMASLATSFQWLLAARAVQGMGAAAPRIVTVAVVRDLYAGRQMARIMSLVMTTFIMVPVFAPSIGQLLAIVGDWRTPIMFLAGAGLVATAWAWVRLPETSPRHAPGIDKPAQTAPSISYFQALRAVYRSRQTVGYVMANGCMFACLMSYILSSQQIFVDIYALGAWFPLAFGAIAIAIALSGAVNALVVVRYGMRHVSHRALLAFIAVAGCVAVLGFVYGGQPPFWALWIGLWVQFLFFGLIVSNFNALAIEPLGHVAGTASSVMGSYTTLSGAVFGTSVGQLFDMTTLPMNVGFVVFSSVSLIIVLITERGRLFHSDSTA
ncbi:MAG: multidrug effflux MFS transporter [Hyphomicrobiaceae bacterium]